MTQFKDTAMRSECEWCERKCTVTDYSDYGELLEFCPFCGLDGYGCTAYDSRAEQIRLKTAPKEIPGLPKSHVSPCGDPNCPAADWGCAP